MGSKPRPSEIKVLFLTREYPPEVYGGAGVHVDYLTRELAKLIPVEVRTFGDQTLTVIDRESKRLEEVEGIGPARREMIKNSWNAQKAVREIMVFLQSHSVGTAAPSYTAARAAALSKAR